MTMALYKVIQLLPSFLPSSGMGVPNKLQIVQFHFSFSRQGTIIVDIIAAVVVAVATIFEFVLIALSVVD
jgi:hypothetical protein